MSLADDINEQLARLNPAERRLAEIRLSRILKRQRALRRFPTPGHLAAFLDPTTVQTPLMAALDKIALECDAGARTRWLISCPPQEGKSQRTAIATPLWLLLRKPSRRIVIASYEQGVAARSGLAVRQAIATHGGGYKGEHRGQDHEDVLGLLLDPDRAQQTNWNLADSPGRRDGGVLSAGIGSALTGRPADVLIIDDPVKDAKAADSEDQRQTAWEWYRAVATTRLAPGAIVIVIQTRWHEDDLMGRILRQDDAQRIREWGRLFGPAQAGPDDPLGREPGEWLVSARGRQEADWLKIRKDVGERWWAALYQCRPAPPAGGIYQLSWIENHRVAEHPELETIGVFVDPADNEGTGDEAGLVVAGKAGSEYYILADLSRHMTVGRWLRRALVEALRWGASSIRYERSLSGLPARARQAWKDLIREAKKLHDLWQRDNPGEPWHHQPDPNLIAVAAKELARDDHTLKEIMALEVDLQELWSVVPAALLVPGETGVPVESFSAVGSKSFRARMVAPLYEGGHVHHVGFFPEYEHQLVSWQESQDSPDRMDAGVHALTILSATFGGASMTGSTGQIPGVA